MLGTEVEVKLPLAQINESLQEQGESIVDFEIPLVAEKPSILLVEDNAEMVQYLVGRLSPYYNLVVAQNGQQALDKIDKLSSLDLIISDVMMKDMDGFQFGEKVFAKKNYTHIPFIYLTAKASSEDKIKGLSLGAIDYIEKPFKIQELITKIDSLFSNLKKQREALINQAYRTMLSKSGEISSDKRFKEPSSSEIFHRYRLTSREIDIIKLLITGQPYKLIGDHLNISAKTVAKHISNIFTKVGVNNKLELINKLDFSTL